MKFNGACLRPPIPRPITQNKGMQVKFVDDASQMASVNLKKSLIPDCQARPRPLRYSERTEMVLNPTEDTRIRKILPIYRTEQTCNK